MLSFWAPLASLHFLGSFIQESDKAIKAGWCCDPPIGLLANVTLLALIAPPGKKLAATPAYPGISRGFLTANNTGAVFFPQLLLHLGVF